MKLKSIALLFGPLAFFLVKWLGPSLGWTPDAASVLAAAAWILIWWISEAAPIAVTSLLPIVLFPLTGVVSLKETTALYGSHYVFLFMGGFLVAIALERVQLHRRLALMLLSRVGTRPDRIILGFMIGTALLSMWISNTATTLMMLPIAMSVIRSLELPHKGFAQALLLGTAYAANIGGMSTLVGTPPNIAMAGLLAEQHNVNIGFVEWFKLTGPLALILLALTYLMLTRLLFPIRKIRLDAGATWIEDALNSCGPWRTEERRVLWVFVALAVAWMSRKMLVDLTGWPLSDTGIAMIAGIGLFLIPESKSSNRRLLEWEDTAGLPWNILLLFGGGLALAEGLSKAGILEVLVRELGTGGSSGQLVLPALIFIALALFLTEVMSNLALTVVMVPVVAALALQFGAPAWSLAIPITWASSCAFMLPMATPPNAIVFGSQLIPMSSMARTGLLLNLLAVVIIFIWTSGVLPYFLFS
jgi:sodium-dependent dicarboxylate transporter 2/3/5